MIVLDGKVYQALNTSAVIEMADEEGIPFATVTIFKAEKKESYTDVEKVEE